MYAASNIHYDLSQRMRGLDTGSIGALHALAQQTGLVDAVDEHVHVLKRHLPYHESDHVLGIAYNILCGGTCLQGHRVAPHERGLPGCVGRAADPGPNDGGRLLPPL